MDLDSFLNMLMIWVKTLALLYLYYDNFKERTTFTHGLSTYADRVPMTFGSAVPVYSPKISVPGNWAIHKKYVTSTKSSCLCQNNSMHGKETSLLFSNVANPDPRSSVFFTHGSGSGIRDEKNPESGKKHTESYF
jgi:hypothetical protein